MHDVEVRFYRTVEGILGGDPVKEHHYLHNPTYHAQVHRAAGDIAAIAHASATMKECPCTTRKETVGG